MSTCTLEEARKLVPDNWKRYLVAIKLPYQYVWTPAKDTVTIREVQDGYDMGITELVQGRLMQAPAGCFALYAIPRVNIADRQEKSKFSSSRGWMGGGYA